MKYENFKHENVDEMGNVKGGGNVHTRGRIITSNKIGGCDLLYCKCSQGHWITFAFPRNEKEKSVSGIKIIFENKIEMTGFMDAIKSAYTSWEYGLKN